MEKDKFKKWRKRFISNANPTDFSLDMTNLKENKVILKHKEVKFASLNRDEYNLFENWNKKEQLQFLEDYFNFYMSLMD